MNPIFAFQVGQDGHGLLLQLLSLVQGLVVHAPGVKEVVPVDVGRQLVDVVVDNHEWEKVIASPRTLAETWPFA